MCADAESLLRQMLGSQAQFRTGQWEAIEVLVGRRGRVLLVQRTGWGKSLVYWIATKLLRGQGAGPTLLVSPLLSLMRNQILSAQRIGVRAATIHSGNRDEWQTVEEALAKNDCDVLLISPERLANPRFLNSVLPAIGSRVGLLVIDEAHCISDWGHDFRPDYRRIVRILAGLPRGVPMLATTATANDRVVADVVSQVGADVTVLRGPLARRSLRLQNLRIARQADRLAWLAENLHKFPGSGIIYCLTVADTQRVAAWLKRKGHAVEAYHAGDDAVLDREALEAAMLENRVKALVATVALGMGFDKPDLGFVIHFQRPGSVVAYYQQVGRAGREIERAYGILLAGDEDDQIVEYFIGSAFPQPRHMEEILAALEAADGLSLQQLLDQVNISRSLADTALRLLEIDGAVARDRATYFRTPNAWDAASYVERARRVTSLRRGEVDQMCQYVGHRGCLMEFLARALDDPAAGPCGCCANCQGKGFRAEAPATLVAEAETFLHGEELVIEPRRRWPTGLLPKATISDEVRTATGRALCYYAHDGWGRLVQSGKYVHGRYADELVEAAAALVSDRWRPEPAPLWVTAIPSLRHATLVPDFAERLAQTRTSLRTRARMPGRGAAAKGNGQ